MLEKLFLIIYYFFVIHQYHAREVFTWTKRTFKFEIKMICCLGNFWKILLSSTP